MKTFNQWINELVTPPGQVVQPPGTGQAVAQTTPTQVAGQQPAGFPPFDAVITFTEKPRVGVAGTLTFNTKVGGKNIKLELGLMPAQVQTLKQALVAEKGTQRGIYELPKTTTPAGGQQQ